MNYLIKVICFLKSPYTFKSYITSKINALKNRLIIKYINIKNPFFNKDGFLHRQYNSTQDYFTHQKAKLTEIEEQLKKTYDNRVECFMNDFKILSPAKRQAVLCLGSRDGAEVDALRRLGFLSIGIDLVYPSNNAFVHYGDFHDIPYPDNVFDIVYTNTLDHINNPSKIFTEVRRILKNDGIFFAKIVNGMDEGFALNGPYESFVWKTKKQLVELISKFDFILRDEIKCDKNYWFYLFKIQK